MFDNNFILGNGTDPIDVKGVSIAYGFGQVSANVNLSNGLQGYGFQFNVDAAASISNSAYNAAFTTSQTFTVHRLITRRFAASPNIEEIQNNSNYNGLQITPNITTFTGNANFTGVGIYGNLGNFEYRILGGCSDQANYCRCSKRDRTKRVHG